MNRRFSLGYLGLKGGLVVEQGLLVLGVEGRAAQILRSAFSAAASSPDSASEPLAAALKPNGAFMCARVTRSDRLRLPVSE